MKSTKKLKIELVRHDIAPYGVKCLHCNKTAKEGQFVLSYSMPNVGWLVLHKKCMELIMEEMPNDLDNSIEDEYNEVKQSLIKGTAFK